MASYAKVSQSGEDTTYYLCVKQSTLALSPLPLLGGIALQEVVKHDLEG